MNFEQWLTDLLGTRTRRDVMKSIGKAESTLSRQLDRGRITPEMVISLCRECDRLPAQGLIETGYLKPWEVEGAGIDHALDQATNQQLLDAIMRRSDPEATYLFGQDLINPDDNVVDFEPPSNTDADSVAHDGTVKEFDWEPGTYAADSTPDEDALREAEGSDPID